MYLFYDLTLTYNYVFSSVAKATSPWESRFIPPVVSTPGSGVLSGLTFAAKDIIEVKYNLYIFL